MAVKSVLHVLDQVDPAIHGKLGAVVWCEPGEKEMTLSVPGRFEQKEMRLARIFIEIGRVRAIYDAAGMDFDAYEQTGLGAVELPAAFTYRYREQTAVAPDDGAADHIQVPRKIPFSETVLSFALGEGLLDFLYADFDKAAKEVTENKDCGLDFQARDDREQQLYDGLCLAQTVKCLGPVLSASVYTMAMPPIMEQRTKKELSAYLKYLKALQEKLAQLLEFVYDQSFYPKVLGGLSENERYAYYCRLMKCPTQYDYTYTIDYPAFAQYPSAIPELLAVAYDADEPKDPEIREFYERFATTDYERIRDPYGLLFPIERFNCTMLEEALLFEFWQMMKRHIQLRRCKRCGRYFIMKGNYDTNYCDRIAEGETRTCQQLAAQENYKKKMADNAAIALYQKYYKRYAARVKVRQIKGPDFKKWKYEAMTKRDACTAGEITVEEYEDWLEEAFPNRKKKG